MCVEFMCVQLYDMLYLLRLRRVFLIFMNQVY